MTKKKTNEELIAAYQNGDKEALNILLKQNTGLVYKQVLKLVDRNPQLRNIEDDLVQVGLIQMAKCAQKFDQKLGNRFTTYACSSMRGAMYTFLKKERMIRIPLHSKDLNSINVIALDEINLSAPQFAYTAERDELLELVIISFNKLDPILKEIIIERLDGKTLQEIANRLKLSRERIRQIEAKGLIELKNMLLEHCPELYVGSRIVGIAKTKQHKRRGMSNRKSAIYS